MLVLLMAHELIVIIEFRERILILILLWVKIVNVYHFNESHGNPRLRSVSHHGQHKSNKGRKRNDNNHFFDVLIPVLPVLPLLPLLPLLTVPALPDSDPFPSI